MQHLGFVIGEAHIFVFYTTLDICQVLRIFAVFERRLGAHQLQKPLEARRTLHIKLGKLRELSYGGHKGADIQRKGHKLNVTERALHDEKSAGGYHRKGHDA